MTLIDRYLFRQLLGPTLLATAALSSVAMLSESLDALDLIVNQGQSAAVFIKITLLGLPSLVSMILPISVFVSTLVALNRLHTEQEIVVCFAGGMSRWRVISPTLRLACMAALVALAINLWLQPLCAREMRAELIKARTDLVSTLVQEGRFTQPSPGLTVYAQQVLGHGALRNVFIDEEKNGASTTFSARDGQIAQRNGLPVLIMRHGSHQDLNHDGALNFVSFDEDTLELTDYLPADTTVRFKPSDRYLHELFHPDKTQDWEQKNLKKLYSEGHARLASPLYNLAMVCLALGAVLGGGFSRMGYGRRISTAAAVAAVTRIVGVGVQAACDTNPSLNALQYLVPLAAASWALYQVFSHKTPRRAARLRSPVLQRALEPAE